VLELAPYALAKHPMHVKTLELRARRHFEYFCSLFLCNRVCLIASQPFADCSLRPSWTNLVGHDDVVKLKGV
jgi:hypothetical protein